MSTIMSGAYEGGSPNPHMIFVNVIIGYILVPFYQLFPQVNWYFVCQLILLLSSFTLVSYMFLEKNGKIAGVLLSVLMLAFFTNDAYILMQFTKTATVVVMCASLVFIWSLFGNRRKSLTLISGILCLFGTMIRFSTIYLAGIFLILILIAEFANMYFSEQNKKLYLKRMLKLAVIGITLIVAIFVFKEIDKKIYNSDEAYKVFLEYNRARAAVMDAPDHGYEAYREELEKVGVSENDYYVLRRWNFSDDEVFSVAKLNKIADIIGKEKENNPLPLGDIYEQMQMRKVMSYPIVLACVVLLVMTIILQKYQWIYGGIAIGMAVVLEGWLIAIERPVYRVEYSIFMSVFLCISYFWKWEKMRFTENREQMIRIFIAILVVIIGYKSPLLMENSAYVGVTDEYRKGYLDAVFYDSWSYDARKYRRVVNKGKPECSLIDEIVEHKENFYFFDFRTTIQTLYFEWSPIENVDPEFYENCQYFSGVTSKFPGMEENAKKYGVDNYFKSLVNDNVYIVDNEGIEQKVLYLQEHYYPEARAELYQNAGGYQIWKIYKE